MILFLILTPLEEQNETAPIAQTKTTEAQTYGLKDNNDTQATIATAPQPNQATPLTEEAIKALTPPDTEDSKNITSLMPSSIPTVQEETKKQPPSNMIVFLKNIKNDITLTDNNTFIHEAKEYSENDIFLDFYHIEKITPLFIRFVNDKKNLAYNLRFVE